MKMVMTWGWFLALGESHMTHSMDIHGLIAISPKKNKTIWLVVWNIGLVWGNDG